MISEAWVDDSQIRKPMSEESAVMFELMDAKDRKSVV